MTKLLMALLPSRYKAMFEVSEKIFQNMKTDEQRKDIFDYILVMFDDDSKGGSRVTVGEWAKLGGLLGILKGK